MILIRFALYLSLAAVAGLSCFALLALPREGDSTALPFRSGMLAGAVLALAGSILWLPFVAAQMAGTSVWPVDGALLKLVIGSTPTGKAWAFRMVALVAVISMILWPIFSARSIAVIAVISCSALASLAWAGHGAMNEGAAGWLHLGANVAHLIASAVWVGALLGLIAMVVRPAVRSDADHLAATYRALRLFGPIGTVVVATLVATGLVNGWFLVGPNAIGSLPATPYGRLLLGKLALFAIMLMLASLNRFLLTPAFGAAIDASDHHAALGALRLSIAIETASAVLILGLVAWLGILEPPLVVG